MMFVAQLLEEGARLYRRIAALDATMPLAYAEPLGMPAAPELPGPVPSTVPSTVPSGVGDTPVVASLAGPPLVYFASLGETSTAALRRCRDLGTVSALLFRPYYCSRGRCRVD